MTVYTHPAQPDDPDPRPIRVYGIDLDEQVQADRFYTFVAALPRLNGQAPGAIPDRVDLRSRHPMPDAHYLVAQVDEQVVGAVAVLPDELSGLYGYHMAHVARFRLDVLPDWWAAGVPQALVRGLVEWAKEQSEGGAFPGLRRLETELLSCQQDTVDVLQSVGFVVEGRARSAWHVRTAEGPFDLDVLSLGMLIEEAEPAPVPPPAESDATVEATVPDVDCVPFFDDLVDQVRAFLPYELRQFETRQTANELYFLVEGLPQDVSVSLAFRLASETDQTPDMIELGLHFRGEPDFNRAQVEDFGARLDELEEAVGGKTLHADLWGSGWGRVAQRLPYQPPEEVQAFMLAAQVAGFITVMLPEVQAKG